MESEAPWVDFITVQSSLSRATFHCIGYTSKNIRCRRSIGLPARHEVRMTLEPWGNDIPPATDLERVLEKLLCHSHRSLKNAYRRRWTDESAANCRRISTPPGRSQLAVPQIDRSRAGSAPPDVDASMLDASMYGVSSAKDGMTAFQKSFAGLTVSGTPDEDNAYEQDEDEENDNASEWSDTESVVTKVANYEVLEPKSPPPRMLSQSHIRSLESDLVKILDQPQSYKHVKNVYIFSTTELPGLVKVGISEGVSLRQKQIMGECGLKELKNLHTSRLLDRAKLVESLTHKVLKAWGFHVQVQCGHKKATQRHQEWFKCDEQVIIQIINIWEEVQKHYQPRHPDQWLSSRLKVFEKGDGPRAQGETLEDMIKRHQTFWASE
ncbi:hypothetical protein SLS56_009956 [Neofusicoccum ribis]|uniref:Bacteriophage T5 Orf172 DNA-binding domain-containing protein n=1 Tax=Neofusicoccum ribis TaxID=45134 RepID=A0ABR3SGP5_9PEZI